MLRNAPICRCAHAKFPVVAPIAAAMLAAIVPAARDAPYTGCSQPSSSRLSRKMTGARWPPADRGQGCSQRRDGERDGHRRGAASPASPVFRTPSGSTGPTGTTSRSMPLLCLRQGGGAYGILPVTKDENGFRPCSATRSATWWRATAASA
jgi:hypothetical protein